MDAPQHGRVAAASPSKPRLFRPAGLAREPAAWTTAASRATDHRNPSPAESSLQLRAAAARLRIQIARPAPEARRRYCENLYAAATRGVRARPETSQASTSPFREYEGVRDFGEKRPLAAGDSLSRGNTCYPVSVGTTYRESLAEEPFG